jgi:bifunctional non-homologous end joining protein LigD
LDKPWLTARQSYEQKIVPTPGTFDIPIQRAYRGPRADHLRPRQLGFEGIVSKRLGSPYRSGRSRHWVKSKNPKHPAVKREAEEDWGRALDNMGEGARLH